MWNVSAPWCTGCVLFPGRLTLLLAAVSLVAFFSLGLVLALER